MLNLEAKTKPQEIIKAYLEQHADETLTAKINNGVRVEKDGKTLLNKKTLDGFMNYASSEAKKLAEAGSNSACVEDAVVFGWAMHYFTEDSIEGTLYNLDGTEYKQPKKETQKASKQKTVAPAKKENLTAQCSLFDAMMEEEKSDEKAKKPTLDEILDYNIDEDHDDDEDEETSEEMQEALKHIEAEKQETKSKVIPFYQRYLDLQKSYPTANILMRVGDFYEAFGDNAIILSDELNLTLTSRDVGLPERVPMVGFPFHAADSYFLKIHDKYDLLVCESDDKIRFLATNKKQPSVKHRISDTCYVDNDGVIHEEAIAVPDWMTRLFDDKIIVR